MAEIVKKAPTVNQYEGMFLFGQSAAADVEASLKLVRSIIERHEGKILVIKRWDERKLAYEISGQKRGTYVITYFQAPSTAVAAIERDVKLSEEVLRVLVLHADHMNQAEMEAVEPQPIVREERPSWERDDRPPRRDDRGPRSDDRGPRTDDRAPRTDRPRRDEPAAEPAGANKD
ncbi:MAG: rpsF [Phycisphaerales bacterium]|nr:rpsF [Phycisphaerales bacterium]MDB5302622.1 rpsF [Phycisphaerales bacterium]